MSKPCISSCAVLNAVDVSQVAAISVQAEGQLIHGPDCSQNFKAFRKIWPQGYGVPRPTIGYAPAAYSDTAVDAEAFLR